jgi:hypothetical protein
MKLNVVFVCSRKKVRNANITIEKKIIAEKNVYKIGDVFIFLRRFRVISVRRRRQVSSMFFPPIEKVRITVQAFIHGLSQNPQS